MITESANARTGIPAGIEGVVQTEVAEKENGTEIVAQDVMRDETMMSDHLEEITEIFSMIEEEAEVAVEVIGATATEVSEEALRGNARRVQALRPKRRSQLRI